jgi:hypothetical protein
LQAAWVPIMFRIWTPILGLFSQSIRNWNRIFINIVPIRKLTLFQHFPNISCCLGWLPSSYRSEVRLIFVRQTLFGFNDMYSGIFERSNLVQNGSILDVWNATNTLGFHIILYVWLWFAELGPKIGVFSNHIMTALKTQWIRSN